MSPNFVQRTVAAFDLASAQLAQRNSTPLRGRLRSLTDLRQTAANAIVTRHLERARGALANGDRPGFERRCERASRLAHRHAPDRVEDVESTLTAGSRTPK